MNPWTIIGWGIVAVFAIPTAIAAVVLVYALLRAKARRIANLVRHYRTRRQHPLPGQTWVQDDSLLHIKRIAENGRVCIDSGRTSWSDSDEDWRRRVRKRRLWRAS